jgi:polyhydroxyalkanoate synthesis repressor PhaR
MSSSFFAKANFLLLSKTVIYDFYQFFLLQCKHIFAIAADRSFALRLLKKYPNRRIYDTEESKFVALAEIRQMIIARETVKVVHSKTGKDLTRSVLMQIITEMEAEGHQSLLTNRILEELIRFYGDKVVAMIGPYLEQQILQSLAAQDKIREQWTKAFAQPYPTPDQVIRQMVEQYQKLTGQAQAPAEPATDTSEPDEAPEEKPGKNE